MKFTRGQVLVEYILLSLLVAVTTVAVVKFIVYDVFRDSMTDLKGKTTNCISSNNKSGECK
jgi:uncharacterized protein (UPF0333 family)